MLAGQIAAGAETPDCHAIVGRFDCKDVGFRDIAQRRPGARNAGGRKIDCRAVGEVVEAGSPGAGRYAPHGELLIAGNWHRNKNVFADPRIRQTGDPLVGHGRVDGLRPQVEGIERLDGSSQLEGSAGFVEDRLIHRLRNRSGDPAEEAPAVGSRRGLWERDLIARRAGHESEHTAEGDKAHRHGNRRLGHVLREGLESVIAVAGGIRPRRVPRELEVGGIGMRGMRHLHVIVLVVGNGGIVERERLGTAEFHHDGKALSGAQPHRAFQPDGLVAPVVDVPGLCAGEGSGSGVVHGAVGIDPKGEIGIVAAHAEGDGLKRFVAVGDKGLRNRVAAGQILPTGIVAGAVVLVVVVIVLDALHREEGDVSRACGGVLIGYGEVAIITDVGSPRVFYNPRAVMARAVALIKVFLGEVVVPADDGYVVIGIVEGGLRIRLIGLNPADCPVGHVHAAMIGTAALIGYANAHGAGAVFHNMPFHLRDVGAEEVLDGLDVGNVVLIGVVRAEAGVIGAAVHQRRFRLGGEAGPTHERITDQLARAALIEEIGVDRAEKIRPVTGQHSLRVIGGGIGIVGQMELGQVQALIRRFAGGPNLHAVLDHVRLTRGGGGKGPAGVKAALISNRGDVAVVAAVIGCGKVGSRPVVLFLCAVNGLWPISAVGKNRKQSGGRQRRSAYVRLPLGSQRGREHPKHQQQGQKQSDALLQMVPHNVLLFVHSGFLSVLHR